MAEHLIQDTTLTGIADMIRSLLGLTGTMTTDQMQTNLTTEQANIAAALAALTEKGVEVPTGANSNALAGLIAAIEAGGAYVAGTITADSDVAILAIGNISDVETINYPLKFALCLCLEAEEMAAQSEALAFAVAYRHEGERKSAAYINKAVEFGSYGIYASRGSVYIGKFAGGSATAIKAGKTYLYIYEE